MVLIRQRGNFSMSRNRAYFLLLSCAVFQFFTTYADEQKIELRQPVADSSAKTFADLPDGVNLIKTKPDGSFDSLVVKATVEIDDLLGISKGRQRAQSEAQLRCKAKLTDWLGANCTFLQGLSNTTTIVTKGESTKDDAGKEVKFGSKQGTEWKAITENVGSVANAWVSGLESLQTEVTSTSPPEFVLVMGLSQKNIDQSRLVRDALSGKVLKVDNAGKKSDSEPSVAPERKTNPNASSYLPSGK